MLRRKPRGPQRDNAREFHREQKLRHEQREYERGNGNSNGDAAGEGRGGGGRGGGGRCRWSGARFATRASGGLRRRPRGEDKNVHVVLSFWFVPLHSAPTIQNYHKKHSLYILSSYIFYVISILLREIDDVVSRFAACVA